ncbi:TPA: LysE family translocator [Vibrio vulnificus]|uniref:LysE family translocator n=2 Tax=Vibrio vulnificus TaxID=672 RepID=A0A8H9N4U2_VIBVL|nr:LysE family translocator [Vibrio vulnificus]EGQ9934433.1 LysE family translocator [Vibrio vulnificus]ELI0351165.1 LysE family translocator [Vibrio vulnificus]ELI0612215.1 LysE family translocator [Vibrio vulnificus]MCU8225377.1 LysE family translocator [Vibrio vulnificus]MCU8273169.1 LysE family translocator [Vibrio vulnificus]
MNELTILLTLAGVHFIALMSPGPDVALVVQNASRYGRQTGLFIALGLSVGILLHSLLSLTGVSYLVHQQPMLYALLQLLGGSYLLYLGIGALNSVLRHWHQPSTNPPTSQRQLALNNKRQAFLKGFATNILNPKALVFFVSLLSSLIPTSMSLSGKATAVMILFMLSFLWFASLAWALSGSRMQQYLHKASIYIDGICGVLFCLIGAGILYNTVIHQVISQVA